MNYKDIFKKHTEEVFFSKLKEDFEKDDSQPYRIRRKGLKNFTLVLSYATNILSLFGAWLIAFIVIKYLVQIDAIAIILASLFLLGMEWFKRYSSNEVWRQYWPKKKIAFNWLAASIIITILSGVAIGLMVILIIRVMALSYFEFPDDLTWFNPEDMNTYFESLPESAFIN